MRRIAVLVVIGLGCGGGGRAPVAPPSNRPVVEPARAPDRITAPPRGAPVSERALEAMMAQAVGIFESMGAAADQHPNDCGKLADALDRVMADNRAYFAEARTWKDDPDLTQRIEAWFKVHQSEVMTPMMKVANAGQKCAADPKFMATMERLSKLGD